MSSSVADGADVGGAGVKALLLGRDMMDEVGVGCWGMVARSDGWVYRYM